MLIMQFPAHCCILYLCICLYVFVFIYLYLCICICVFLFAILIRLTQLNANHAIPCSERLLWKMCKRVGCERLEKGGHLRKIGGNTWSYTHLRWDEDNRLEKHIFSSKSLLSLLLRRGFHVNQFARKNMIWAPLRKFDLNESCARLENSSTCLLTCSPCHDVGKQEFCGKLAALDKAQINLIGIIGKPSTPVAQDKLDASMVLISCRCIAARQGSVCFHGVPFVFARQPWDRETAYKLLPITL